MRYLHVAAGPGRFWAFLSTRLRQKKHHLTLIQTHKRLAMREEAACLLTVTRLRCRKVNNSNLVFVTGDIVLQA